MTCRRCHQPSQTALCDPCRGEVIEGLDRLAEAARRADVAYRAAPSEPPVDALAEAPDSLALLDVSHALGALIDDLLDRIDLARAVARILDGELIGPVPALRYESARERDGRDALKLLVRFEARA